MKTSVLDKLIDYPRRYDLVITDYVQNGRPEQVTNISLNGHPSESKSIVHLNLTAYAWLRKDLENIRDMLTAILGEKDE